MANYVTYTSDKSKKVAFLLCLFLGVVPLINGCYYWYVGREMGFWRSVTFNNFFLGWIGDLIKIANGSFRDNVGAPLRK